MDRKYQEIKNILKTTFNCKVTKCTIVTRKAICVDFNDPQEGQWFETHILNQENPPIKHGVIIVEGPIEEEEPYKYAFTVRNHDELIQQILKYNN